MSKLKILLEGNKQLLWLVSLGLFLLVSLFEQFALEQNLCQLCISTLLSQQTSVCNGPMPQAGLLCGFCPSLGSIENNQNAAESITVHAHQMETDTRFLYKRQEFSTNQIVLYNEVLNINFTIPISQPISLGQTTSPEIPVALSSIDGVEIPVESLSRFWWNAAATTAVTLAVSNYQLELFAQNDIPAPIMLRVSVNDRQLGLLWWEKGDNSWESKCLYIPAFYLSNSDVAMVKIEYINDEIIENIDRNAALSWARFVPVSQ